uniref:Uncharacterized protein n=1 Tax=Anguilla anguilla TaxID=7936 RepID=A0A0E9P681_ANGAN
MNCRCFGGLALNEPLAEGLYG